MHYLIQVLSAFVIVYFTHQYIIEFKQTQLRYNLLNVYLFYAIAAMIVYGAVALVAKKMPTQAGYAFLATVFLKIGFFVLLFNDTLFSEVKLTIAERGSLIIPFFLFLTIEAIQITKLLNSKEV